MSRKPFNGYATIIKTGGVGPLSGGSQRDIPLLEAIPANPMNNGYLPVVNHTSYPSLRALGKRTPGFSMATCWKPVMTDTFGTHGWMDADLVNSLLGLFALDSRGNTDRFSAVFEDNSPGGSGIPGLRLWDWSRCESISLSQAAMGGPISVQLGFLSRWGDNECPYGQSLPDGEVAPPLPSWLIPTGAMDAGEVTPVTATSFANTLDKVRSWSLTMVRGQAYQAYVDGSNYPKEVDSTMFSGGFTIQQDPDSNLYVGKGGSHYGAASLEIATDMGSGSRTRIDFNISLDGEVYPFNMQLGNVTRTYSLINLATGGQPVVVTQY